MRWSEYVEKDLLRTKIKIWRKKAVDREEWASVLMEAKALRSPYSQEVSKQLRSKASRILSPDTIK
jgi:hypothetical protein